MRAVIRARRSCRRPTARESDAGCCLGLSTGLSALDRPSGQLNTANWAFIGDLVDVDLATAKRNRFGVRARNPESAGRASIRFGVARFQRLSSGEPEQNPESIF